jgi:hypothetical protein
MSRVFQNIDPPPPSPPGECVPPAFDAEIPNCGKLLQRGKKQNDQKEQASSEQYGTRYHLDSYYWLRQSTAKMHTLYTKLFSSKNSGRYKSYRTCRETVKNSYEYCDFLSYKRHM